MRYKYPFLIFNNHQKTIRDVAVRELCDLVSDYSDWYENHGLVLPRDFANDPTGWTVALQKMKRAFCLLRQDMDREGELYEAKKKWEKFGEKDGAKIEELNTEIREGLSLFGKYLLDLTDDSNT